MKAVLRLVYTYFTCTPAQKAFSLAGATMIALMFVILVAVPQSWVLGVVAFPGIGSLCIGSSMMPLMFGRMARNHLTSQLPGARLKLLASALITVVIVAIPAPVLAYLGLSAAKGPHVAHPTAAQIVELAQFHRGIVQTFWVTFSSAIVLALWIYVALWFITSKRNTVGYLQGLTVIGVVLLSPKRQIMNPEALVTWDLTVCVVALLAFSTLFLLWPRIRLMADGLALGTAFRYRSGAPTRTRGREIDLLLGTGNPWLLAVGQLLPVFLAARIGFYSAAVWLFYLTIFSTVAGAIAGQAAERSRALWLRGDWSTVQLFSRVEWAFWRHNNHVLAILLILMVAIGRYANLPVLLLVTGLPLLVLGTILSTYLGLMLTRGLHLLEILLAIGVMLALMAVAVLAARNANDPLMVILLEATLGLVALGLRFVARGRWARIDWMQCRPDRALSGRSAA